MFPAYRQQLRKQGAGCLVSGGGSVFLPPLGQYGPSFVAYFPIPPLPGAIIQLEEQHGVYLLPLACVLNAAYFFYARFAVFQIKCVDDCPHGRTPFPQQMKARPRLFQDGFVSLANWLRRIAGGGKRALKFDYPFGLDLIV